MSGHCKHIVDKLQQVQGVLQVNHVLEMSPKSIKEEVEEP